MKKSFLHYACLLSVLVGPFLHPIHGASHTPDADCNEWDEIGEGLSLS